MNKTVKFGVCKAAEVERYAFRDMCWDENLDTDR